MEKIKITHAIIRNGISRGITEGTKVPEKSSFTCIECTKMGCSLKKCNKAYEEDFWDASVEWEDQEAVLNKLPPSALKGIIRVIDGIYPLEGVNAENVDQYCYIEYPDKQISQWFDGSPPRSAKGGLKKDRVVLRLIPQPNSEQKTFDEIRDKLRERMKAVNDVVEGTEVSEPTLSKEEYQAKIRCNESTCQRDGCGPAWCVGYECYKPKVEVEEKKEPEINREEKVNNLLDVVELYKDGYSPESILKNFSISRVSGEPPKPDQRIQHIKDVLNDGDMRLALHLLEELTGGSVPTPSDEPLRGALTKIIEMNRQHAQDQYGDANKAESWACVTVAREALRGDKKSESSIPNKESRP